MSEKRGYTGKLIYDFPTYAVLEIKLASGVWHRVTSTEFRSWIGERRLTITKQPGIGDSFDNVEKRTIAYNGPVYLYGTNKKNNSTDSTPRTATSEKLQKDLETSKNRNRGARI